MTEHLTDLHMGGKSEQARAMAAAMNRRLETRSLADRKVHVFDGPMTVTRELLDVAVTAAWALGVERPTLNRMGVAKVIPADVAEKIRHPGRRSDTEKARGQKRIAAMRKARKRRAAAAKEAGRNRRAIVAAAKQAKANYARRPSAYHYLAGGRPNTIVMEPTPTDWRSDCSQFAVNCYRHAGVPCPGSGSYMFSNTVSIEGGNAIVTRSPKPGDLGMYGPHGRTHHVEVYIGEPGCMFIGHGSPPIDSLTPGLPDFYLTFPELD